MRGLDDHSKEEVDKCKTILLVHWEDTSYMKVFKVKEGVFTPLTHLVDFDEIINLCNSDIFERFRCCF